MIIRVRGIVGKRAASEKQTLQRSFATFGHIAAEISDVVYSVDFHHSRSYVGSLKLSDRIIVTVYPLGDNPCVIFRRF